MGLLDLAAEKRIACRKCMDQGIALEHPRDIDGGIYDCDGVHTWTMWQGNLDSDIAVVGEYWGTVKQFRNQRGQDSDSNPGTHNLVPLLASRGYRISLPSESKEGMDEVFVTNAVLCMQKDEHDDDGSHWERAKNCSEHLMRTLAPVSPSKVVSLGPYAFYGVLLAYRQNHEAQRFREDAKGGNFGRAVAPVWRRGGVCLDDHAWAYPMYNPGGQWWRKNRSMDQMLDDWNIIPKKGVAPR
ncbi:hypothetical protein [Roseomonas genomospecies 6]|uniref:Uracil-DNA glycosylase-like domain-containing protein n=1 Tax=Roseomonas genomospecies 6 TaxID=214106 RepID=A0A9W7KMS5_9PROT|nr:hypothetical protein [Roseomonas genomospecies 6]KAA0675759.1 hypothetical protein DS843_30130 [Roseomonas genomospecies 6]